MVALREIRRYQKSSELLIRKLPSVYKLISVLSCGSGDLIPTRLLNSFAQTRPLDSTAKPTSD